MQPAGTSSRAHSHGVADLLKSGANDAYGPSHASFTQWKHAGHPTATSQAQSAFGMATTRSALETKAILYGGASAVAEPPAAARPVPHHHQPSVNPITWDRAPPEPARRRPDLDEARATVDARTRAGMHHSGMATTVPTPAPAMDAAELQQTWGELLRTRKATSSVATSLVTMPPEFGMENLSGTPYVPQTSVNAIGLGQNHSGIRAHHPRSQQFSKTFSDPFG